MPKARGQHPINRLSAVKVNQLRAPGRHADGNGLYLEVSSSGAKRWLVRTVVQGKRRDIGLGSARLVSLAEAREHAHSIRKAARSGGDPVAERRREQGRQLTFEAAAEQVHLAHAGTWKNDKHAAQWISTLRAYAFPHIGNIPVNQIHSAEILRVLAPIWLTKPETARRVRQRLGTVMDWAKSGGLRDGDNPVLGIARGLPKQPSKRGHHAALPYTEVAGFLERLRGSSNGLIVKAAFEFLVLTATRTSELLGAQWSEIDMEKKLWTIPGDRMKAGKEHRVPLSDRCIELLEAMVSFKDHEGLVFPGSSRGKPLSTMVFLMVLRRMELAITAHGFRSTFRDWASETTSFPHEVAEMALAHTVENKVEAAYRRGDLLEKRREIMNAWSLYCTAANG